MPKREDAPDPEWCPNCEEATARVKWSDDSDWPLTSTFTSLADGENISFRRRCRQCGWREVRELTVSITKKGIPERTSEEDSSESSPETLDELFDS